MKRMILVLLASAAASPAWAQHSGHSQPAPAPAPATCTPEHAAMGHCTIPAPPTQPPGPTPAAAASCTPEHAAMGHCRMPAAPAGQADPHAGHDMPAPSAAPSPAACSPEHAAMGHCTLPPQPAPPAASADPHAGHAAPAQPGSESPASAACSPDHAAMGHCTPSAAAEIPVLPPPPEAFAGPAHAQDLFFDPAAAARSRAELAEEHGGLEAYRFLVDQLEASIREGRDGYAWDGQFWYGGDIDKLWLKTEGEGQLGGELEAVEVQALWSHAIDPWFDLQAGVRQDLRSGPDRTHLILGIQGLAPYWFEVEGAVFLSTKGEVTARAEAEYDLRLTQHLILQPLVEADFSLQDIPEIGLGSGLTSAELGARLRYEFFPRSGLAVIAPYVGVEYERTFGDTARFRRAAGEEVGGWSLLLGLRTWF